MSALLFLVLVLKTLFFLVVGPSFPVAHVIPLNFSPVVSVGSITPPRLLRSSSYSSLVIFVCHSTIFFFFSYLKMTVPRFKAEDVRCFFSGFFFPPPLNVLGLNTSSTEIPFLIRIFSLFSSTYSKNVETPAVSLASHFLFYFAPHFVSCRYFACADGGFRVPQSLLKLSPFPPPPLLVLIPSSSWKSLTPRGFPR